MRVSVIVLEQVYVVKLAVAVRVLVTKAVWVNECR